MTTPPLSPHIVHFRRNSKSSMYLCTKYRTIHYILLTDIVSFAIHEYRLCTTENTKGGHICMNHRIPCPVQFTYIINYVHASKYTITSPSTHTYIILYLFVCVRRQAVSRIYKRDTNVQCTQCEIIDFSMRREHVNSCDLCNIKTFTNFQGFPNPIFKSMWHCSIRGKDIIQKAKCLCNGH